MCIFCFFLLHFVCYPIAVHTCDICFLCHMHGSLVDIVVILCPLWVCIISLCICPMSVQMHLCCHLDMRLRRHVSKCLWGHRCYCTKIWWCWFWFANDGHELLGWVKEWCIPVLIIKCSKSSSSKGCLPGLCLARNPKSGIYLFGFWQQQGCPRRDFYTHTLKKVIRLLYCRRRTLYCIESKTNIMGIHARVGFCGRACAGMNLSYRG